MLASDASTVAGILLITVIAVVAAVLSAVAFAVSSVVVAFSAFLTVTAILADNFLPFLFLPLVVTVIVALPVLFWL